MVAKTG